jgi:hypothetical protein
MFSKRVVVSSLVLGVAVACATAEDAPTDGSEGDTGGKSNAGQTGVAGKLAAAGTSAASQAGATTGSSGGASSGGKTGASGSTGKGGATGSGGGSGGTASGSGGKAGASTAGGAGVAGSSAGSSSAGTSTGGIGSTGMACVVTAAGGAGGEAGNGVGGDASGGGAPSLAAFFDDFESGAVSKWTTTLGTWAIVDDGSKVYEQSLQENKLQIAIANDACIADQVIDAKVKIIGFKGQSNSYVAALFGRVLSPTTHYLLALGSDGKLALRKRVNSTSTGATAIGTAVTTAITTGTWYDVHFEIVGTSLKGCLGAVCVTGTDSSIASGSVAVGTVNTSARFDDVRVTLP